MRVFPAPCAVSLCPVLPPSGQVEGGSRGCKGGSQGVSGVGLGLRSSGGGVHSRARDAGSGERLLAPPSRHGRQHWATFRPSPGTGHLSHPSPGTGHRAGSTPRGACTSVPQHGRRRLAAQVPASVQGLHATRLLACNAALDCLLCSQAKKALDAAIRLDQGSTSAIITLAQWHCKEGHPQAAADL